MSDKINDLIEEARFYESPGHVAAYAEGTLELLRKLADALEAATREPSKDDREALAKIMFDAYADGTGKPFEDEARGIRGLYLEQADAVLAAGFSRAAVPEAATRQPSEDDREAASVHEITVATVAFAKSLVGEGADHEDHDYYRKHIGVALDAVARAAVPDAATEEALNHIRVTAKANARWRRLANKTLRDTEAERDAAVAAIERVKKLLAPMRNRLDEYGEVPLRHAVSKALELLAALDGAPEPEWEWAVRAPGDDEPFSDIYQSRENLAEQETGIAWGDEQLVRRRPAGPWLPVEGESK